jgi:hypothetical protein
VEGEQKYPIAITEIFNRRCGKKLLHEDGIPAIFALAPVRKHGFQFVLLRYEISVARGKLILVLNFRLH